MDSYSDTPFNLSSICLSNLLTVVSMSTPHDIITIHINIICKKLISFEALRLLIIFKFQFKLTVIYVAFVILIITFTSFTLFIFLNNVKYYSRHGYLLSKFNANN
ncbi:hypothetical protein C7P65_10545 [Staphylococcus aureus]|nr:hypothetical protein C7P65_10545 [Staphylococcus aureus]